MHTRTLSPKKIAFVTKKAQPAADALALELAHLALDKGMRVIFAQESRGLAKRIPSAQYKKRIEVLNREKLAASADLIVVLGGDGTLLSIARVMQRHCAPRGVPVMGVHMGQLGFLMEVKNTEASAMLSKVIDGERVRICERHLLEITLRRNGKTIFKGPAVNDAVIVKGAVARIINLDVSVDGKWVQTIRADGMVVSTPTGSTAYSLATGGPILMPNVPALVLSAISPHSLTQRPLVIPNRAEIRLTLKEQPGQVILALDGQDAIPLRKDDSITIRCQEAPTLQLVVPPERDYFALLREKLKFGARD